MNLVIDESVDAPIAKRLKQDGHNVLYIGETLKGISDDEVLNIANQEKSILLTGMAAFILLIIYRKKILKNQRLSLPQ